MSADGAEGRRLAAVVDRLLPGGFGLPSASEAGVPAYLERALAGDPPSTALVLAAVTGLDALARAECGRPFPACGEAECETLLRRGFASADPRLRGGLVRLLELALEGYLAHPEHGGNRDAQVWRALGIDIPLRPGNTAP